MMPDGTTPSVLWDAALQVGARLLHVRRRELSLEEAFLATVGGAA